MIALAVLLGLLACSFFAWMAVSGFQAAYSFLVVGAVIVVILAFGGMGRQR